MSAAGALDPRTVAMTPMVGYQLHRRFSALPPVRYGNSPGLIGPPYARPGDKVPDAEYHTFQRGIEKQCPHCATGTPIEGTRPEWRGPGGPPSDWGHTRGGGYIPNPADHCWRLAVAPRSYVFVGEPYDWTGERHALFMQRAGLAMVDRGWQIEVSDVWARHYPGRTSAVVFVPPGVASRLEQDV